MDKMQKQNKYNMVSDTRNFQGRFVSQTAFREPQCQLLAPNKAAF